MEREDEARDFAARIMAAIVVGPTTHFLPRPARHHDVIRHIVAATGEPVKGDDTQGFYDPETDTFYTRFQAYQRVPFGTARHGQTLFSEDLW